MQVSKLFHEHSWRKLVTHIHAARGTSLPGHVLVEVFAIKHIIQQIHIVWKTINAPAWADAVAAKRCTAVTNHTNQSNLFNSGIAFCITCY